MSSKIKPCCNNCKNLIIIGNDDAIDGDRIGNIIPYAACRIQDYSPCLEVTKRLLICDKWDFNTAKDK
jgi:hypothetical protein